MEQDKERAVADILSRAERAALSMRGDQEDVESPPAPLTTPRPDISRLRPALDDHGLPLFSPGDKIVVERRNAHAPGAPYLDTQTYVVRKIDMGTGDLTLWNEELTQWAADNFVRGSMLGQVYKLAGRHAVAPKRKRGRPRKNPLPETDAPPKPKGKRGRPKGVKNRPRDVIAAEKAAKKAARKK